MTTLHATLSHLLSGDLERLIREWLREDCPSFDYGGYVVGDRRVEARLMSKSPGVLAGVPIFDQVFQILGCNVHWMLAEGARLSGKPTQIATVTGSAHKILLGERVALNVIARCSGVASRSAAMLEAVQTAGFQGILSGTRKTTPGFRLVEKYGMLVGGCDTHRMDLSAMIMLKDNHIAAAGSISQAVAAAKTAGGFAMKVEVECKNETEANEAIGAGADIVMLDNFNPTTIDPVGARLKERWLSKRNFLLEVSGGLNEHNIKNFVSQYVDIISTSSIHQGVPHVDFSLKIIQS